MFLGVDLGTTSVKAVVVDDGGRIVRTGAAPVERFCTPDGGVEQDIEQIWQAARAAIVAAAGGNGDTVDAIGVSSQGAALQLLNQDDRPLGRVISWLDGRGRPFDAELVARHGREFFARRVGHGDSAMTLGQVLRLQREGKRGQSPFAGSAQVHLGYVGDVIVGRLCGRRAHDATSLGIAMLYNPWLRTADPDVLALLEIEESQLPALLPATSSAGGLRPEVARSLGLRPSIPVSPAVHDQYATALGAGCVDAGEVNLGTGTAWVLLAAADRLAPPVIDNAFVCSHAVPGLFGQMLSLGNGGSAVDWAARLLGIEQPSVAAVDRLVESAPAGSEGLRCWPLLTASVDLDAPFKGGRLDGIRLGHEGRHLMRAVVEGLACELTRHLRQLERAGLAIRRLSMCGGAAASRVTPQIVADVTGLPVRCIETPALSALGAAMIARVLADGSELAAVARHWSPAGRDFAPGPNADIYRQVFSDYLRANDEAIA
jgi:xylulokinase